MDRTERKNDVPYIVYESAVARLERMTKRMWILCLVMFISFVASNAFWIWYDKQYEDVVTTTEIEATQHDGTNIINTGELGYGAESESADNN